MTKILGFNITRDTPTLEASHGQSLFPQESSDQGQVNKLTYTPKLPHPTKMLQYQELCNDPETRIGIDLLTDMIAGVGYYTQMPEKDLDGNEVDPDDPKLAQANKWLDQVKFQDKYKQIVRTKLSKGFCPVEHLPNGNIKLLPPETFYIWRTKRGKIFRYTQEVGGAPVAVWQSTSYRESLQDKETELLDRNHESMIESLPTSDLNDITLFIHNEDTSHPYGHSLVDSIAGLIEARQKMNLDIPKIIHRYSSPLGIHEADGDISTFKTAVEQRDVNEDVFVGNVREGSLRHTFLEPTGQTKFLPYVELVYYQIAEAIHAPLILLMKNATEASATKMLESIDRYVEGEQNQNSELIEDEFFSRMLGMGKPVPDFLHGAPNAVLAEMTLDQIGLLKGNGTITWEQAQDLIRQKGIALIEAEKPEPLPILPQLQQDKEKPLLEPQKMHQLELSLQVIKEAHEIHKITITEALREGDRAITTYINKAKAETQRQLNHTLQGKVEQLSPESERYFLLIRNELFDSFRDSLLPTGVRGAWKNEPSSFTVTPNY